MATDQLGGDIVKRREFLADEQLMEEFKKIAREEHKSVDSVVREATVFYLRGKRGEKRGRKLSVAVIGSSGRSDVAAKPEELLLK
jgi:hypothetical protein